MGKHKDKHREEENEEDKTSPPPMEVESSKEAIEEATTSHTNDTKPYEELVSLVNEIAKPMASKKLTKKLYRVVKKAQKAKRLRRGVREVVKALRKNEKGVVVLAGNVSPIDVISHIPVFCEDKGLPYCYVPSRRDLGTASRTKRPTSAVLVQPSGDYEKLYNECHTAVDSLPLPL